MQEDSEPSEATTTAPASMAFNGGYGSHGGPDLGPVFSLTRRVVIGPARSRGGIEIEWHVGRNAGSTGASVAVGPPGVYLGSVLHRDQGGSRWPPSPMLDLGPVFSLTRRVVLNPPRSRGIEIEWHVGRNAGATGASVAVGAPGLDHGPVFNTDTKGDRDGEACWSVVAGLF
ncbi:uncharacterized protein LOC111391002 [Olea europaea var. sylvestris]|uniref:uncharacterized protein LOC111391002 n=1 Tax=Olea europaea var. sylvestris TaxID=158386 RepID=UPI000C1CF012|nr:uncharacterized protein LOC111391002 [Olea europaea var. sylvestris]